MSFTALKTIRPFFTNDCGRLLAGGKVYSYEPGTLTPKPTHKDATGLTENTNPIILDASGEADIYINSDYRFQIFDRDGVLIDDVDLVAATQRVSSEFVLDASGLTQGQINNDVRLKQGQALTPTAAWPDVLSLINQNGAPSIHDIPTQALLNRIQKLYEDAILLSSAVSDRYTKTEADTLFVEAAQIGQPNGVAGLNASGILDPAQFPVASTTQAGLIEIATSTEVNTATDNTRVVTPSTLLSGVKNHLNATGDAPMFACRAWVNFNGVPLNGTYSQSGTTVTVTMTAHGMSVGQKVNLTITSGTAVSGNYTVSTVIDANTFTYTAGTSLTTSGNVTQNNFIRGSGNVLGITDNGVGDYAVNFITAMRDANYIVNGTGSLSVGNGTTVGALVTEKISGLSALLRDTTLCPIHVTNTSGVNLVDGFSVNVSFFR